MMKTLRRHWLVLSLKGDKRANTLRHYSQINLELKIRILKGNKVLNLMSVIKGSGLHLFIFF